VQTSLPWHPSLLGVIYVPLFPQFLHIPIPWNLHMAKLAVQSATKSMHTLSSESHFYPLNPGGKATPLVNSHPSLIRIVPLSRRVETKKPLSWKENGGAYALLLPLVLFRSACDSDCVLCGFIC
jgi:hypothetical protein